ncbi:uncharacterized protein BP5553_10095 [Venustampulla echinocandica]|uniref:DUF6594 domain-containing protein n=1 Tax=Venustampulla echinocandica TaxID=2656787 RepID=A0A370TAE3_9HELO|nr:uncharacterized protein BP5553_10095 [Venustampulla echinocandica]RDL30750.1 hypothetical protein BP5553_10095 [Venustampulla echinocandica]
MADLESNSTPLEYLEGYSDLAAFKASDTQFSVWRRFDRLGAQNLLYYEAEVQHLEFELEKLDEDDKNIIRTGSESEKIGTDARARCWEVLVIQVDRGDEKAIERLDLIMRLRVAMKEYEKALLRRNRISSFGKPDHNSFLAFSKWFRTRVPLRDTGFHLLDDEDDLCCADAGEAPDRLSSLIQRHLGYYVRQNKQIPQSWGEGQLYYYPTERIAWIVAILSVLISTILLIVAIVVLYFVKPMGTRLGIVAAFTVMFTAFIGLLTNARRAEIFGSTAAYAAVLVVFVSVSN